jgi:hypothetical protein
MQADFESRLSADVRALVRETEQFIEAGIIVVVDSNRTRMACNIDEQGAQILVADAAYFPDASVFHELQHIRRILVDGIPRLAAWEDYKEWSPHLSTYFTRLDNNLEHLTIVPIELRAYPDRREYWKGRLTRMIARLNTDEMPLCERHRFAMLALLLAKEMLADEALENMVVDVLLEFNIEEQAERYYAEAIAALATKDQLACITFSYFALPIEAGCLEYLDSRNRRKDIVPLKTI